MDTQTATPTSPSKQQPRLPAGLRWSNVWKTADGSLIEGEREMPVDRDWRISGRLFLCKEEGCTVEEWVFSTEASAPCCTRHPKVLTEIKVEEGDSDPVSGARARLTAAVAAYYERWRRQALDAAQARVASAQAAVSDAARRTATDMRGHLPSIAASGAAITAEAALAATHPALADVAGVVLATAGTVLAYAAAYVVHRLRAWRKAVDLAGRPGRKLREKARHAATAIFLAGVWSVVAGVLGVDPTTTAGDVAILAAPLLTWVAHRRHWESLWETRRRLRELARQKAEEAARRAEEEAAQLAAAANQPATAVVVEEGPVAVGRQMAQRWADIAAAPTVPVGFPMARTWIIPEETREITVPVEGVPRRIGYEFAGACEPGALVARPGMLPPLVAAREWIASMLERDPSTVSMVDRPSDEDGLPRPNRWLMLVTDRAPLGGSVAWKGRAGLRITPDGSIYVHGGRTILGDDIEELMYSPGQPFGGLTVGTTGGGKSAGTILRILNCLVAGIFPVLDDPKQLLDYADFIGIFPIGVTPEHSEVIARSLIAERRRREKHMALRPMTDRLGRRKAAAAVWDVRRDGPPILGIFDEFHMRSKNAVLVALLTEQARTERASAMGLDIITQGGGLADLNNSELRALLNTVRLSLYRMADNLARLAGYSGDYSPSSLPRLAGVRLDVTAEAPPLPLRAAYVTRDDVDGCVYDQLYAPDMTPLLTAATLPKETVEVFEAEGLMDLWRLGKGPNGLANLLSDTTVGAVVPLDAVAAGASVAAGPKVQAADVVLAIAHASGGCPRADIDNHAAWTTAPGWGKPPAPSTISRAAQDLEKTGLLSRADNLYRVTPKGQVRAQAVSDVLFNSAAVAAEQEEERQAELAAEAAA